jgi:hypothetical protein
VQYNGSHIKGRVIVLAEVMDGQLMGACVGKIGYLLFFSGFNVQGPDIITIINGTDKDHLLVIRKDAVAGKIEDHVIVFTAGYPFYCPHTVSSLCNEQASSYPMIGRWGFIPQGSSLGDTLTFPIFR